MQVIAGAVFTSVGAFQSKVFLWDKFVLPTW